MAEITPVTKSEFNNSTTFTWTMTGGDTAQPVDVRRFNSLQLQIDGTFSTNTVALHGSLNGNKYYPLWDSSTQAAISQTADSTKIYLIWEVPDWVKPVVGGDGILTITVKGKI